MVTEKIYQLKIALCNSHPEIWRRVLISEFATFYGLHYIIQIVMGWENAHLFEFQDKKTRIGDRELEDDDTVLDAEELYLGAYFKGRKAKFNYEYDFGDGWLHEIKIEKVLDADPELSYPICIDGELACPPEDCGGIFGYYHMLNVLAAKRHPEKKEIKEWLGSDFDPNYFNVEEVNALLLEFEEIASEAEGEEEEEDDFDVRLN